MCDICSLGDSTDPTEPEVKDDGGTPGPSGTLPGNRPGQVVLRREQWERLASNNSEHQPMRKDEVWTLPEPEEEATGGLRANTAGAPTTFGSTSPLRRKWWTTGVGYSGRAALRREQCDVHALGHQSTV
jgi:hypothetical protein